MHLLCASEGCQQEFGYCQAECAGSINPAYLTPEFVCRAHSQLQKQNKGLFQTQRTKLTEKQTKSEITPYLQPNDIFSFCSSHTSPTSCTILQDYNRKYKEQGQLLHAHHGRISSQIITQRQQKLSHMEAGNSTICESFLHVCLEKKRNMFVYLVSIMRYMVAMEV